MWMLDTDTCSYIFRKHPSSAAQRFALARPDEIVLSSIVLAELCYGVALLPNASHLRGYIQKFSSGLCLLPWGAEAAAHYGDIRAELECKGLSIGSMDMMIAAHARSVDAILVTNDLKHFRRVPGLKLENWI